jgi:hypothetical protein
VVGNYGIVLVFVWLLMIAIITHRLFRTFTVRVKPLHPDGSGGLGLFNRLLWTAIPLVAQAALPLLFGGALLHSRIESSFLFIPIAIEYKQPGDSS